LPYLLRIDAARTYSNSGPLVDELEHRLARLFDTDTGGVVGAASGTAALIGAILATAGPATPARPLAIVPAFTFVATASAVERCGYRPYLVDVDSNSWALDPEHLTGFPALDQVGVIVPVAPFGRPLSVAPWREFAKRTGIPVVVDAAASFEHLVTASSGYVGSVPVVLSFHATKTFSTAEGGAVVTSDLDLASRCRRALNFGFLGSRTAMAAGINGKMSEYHAAIGLAGLDHWPEKRAALHQVANRYRVQMMAAGIKEHLYTHPDVASCYVLYSARSETEADRLKHNLEERQVDYRLWYGHGLDQHRHFSEAAREELPHSGGVSGRIIGLPTAPDMQEADIARVVAAFAATVEGRNSGTAGSCSSPISNFQLSSPEADPPSMIA